MNRLKIEKLRDIITNSSVRGSDRPVDLGNARN